MVGETAVNNNIVQVSKEVICRTVAAATAAASAATAVAAIVIFRPWRCCRRCQCDDGGSVGGGCL